MRLRLRRRLGSTRKGQRLRVVEGEDQDQGAKKERLEASPECA